MRRLYLFPRHYGTNTRYLSRARYFRAAACLDAGLAFTSTRPQSIVARVPTQLLYLLYTYFSFFSLSLPLFF